MQLKQLLFLSIRWFLIGFAIYMAALVFPLFERFIWMQLRAVLSAVQIEQLKLLRGGFAILLALLLYNMIHSYFSSHPRLLSLSRVFSFCLTTRTYSILLITGLILFFISWLPHYLFWPMWMDAEHFAISAQAWDAGIRPYRDLIDFNFPGPIYFYWLIGKVFGWGRPMMANLADVIVLMGFGSVVLCWSRRIFASWAPGLLSCFLMARYYMSLDYARVMQRDWYVFVIGSMAVLTIQAWKNEGRWIVAGILLSAGLVIRPYAVLWGIPVGIALCLEPSDFNGQLRNRVLRLTLSGLVSSILFWSPLFYFQLFDDFLGHLLQELLQSNYKPNEVESLHWIIWDQIKRATEFTSLLVLMLSGIKIQNDKMMKSVWQVWCAAFLILLLYKPLCPVRHDYTQIPFSMTSCLVIGICSGLWIKAGKIDFSRFVLASLVWMHFYFPGWPQMADFQASAQAIQAFGKWDNLKQTPPGCRDAWRIVANQQYLYRWQDYLDLLDYIRNEVPEGVRVVNFLLFHPYPTVNAPTGRLSLWPCGEGILWLSWVHKSMEPDFAKALDSKEPAIVILSDERPGWPPPNQFPAIEKTIRTEFELVTRRGAFQVWARRQTKPKHGGCPKSKPAKNCE